MKYPGFVCYSSEILGKPVSEFSGDDWMNIAIRASEFLDVALGPVKKRGRPRKPTNKLAELLLKDVPKRTAGRKRKLYGTKQVGIETIDELVSVVVKKHRTSKTEATKAVLRYLGESPVYADSAMRLMRDLRKK